MNTPSDYIFLTLDGNNLRFNKNKSLEVSIKRDYHNLDNSRYHPITSTIHYNKKTRYKRRVCMINKVQYGHARLVYKAYNSDWDMNDTTRPNRIGYDNDDATDMNIANLVLVKNKKHFA
tara:strand:+ start:63 stop:419 length:357 start_codon:yes stop_codon:yes gene_type:complete